MMGLSPWPACRIFFIFRRDWRIPAAVILLSRRIVLGREIYPAFVQKFKVIPNEIVAETPYLEQNIKYTRLAYGSRSKTASSRRKRT